MATQLKEKFDQRPALSKDANWIKEIYRQHKKHLGSFDLFMSWQNYMTARKGEFRVIPLMAFVRYAWMNKYTSYVVHEIGVDKAHQGKGLAVQLMHKVPVPVLLKCNKDNVTGNAFYKKIGMDCAGVTHTKKGVEQIIWTRNKPWK